MEGDREGGKWERREMKEGDGDRMREMRREEEGGMGEMMTVGVEILRCSFTDSTKSLTRHTCICSYSY